MKVYINCGSYAVDGSLAVTLMTAEGEGFATITKNLGSGHMLVENEAFIDTNNDPWAVDFIKENHLGKFTGQTAKSGYCEYPVVAFDMDELARHANPFDFYE